MRFGRGWDQFPSDHSLDLSSNDRKVFNLKEKSLSRERAESRRRIEWIKSRRIQQAQTLARRKAERETVENVSRRE